MSLRFEVLWVIANTIAAFVLAITCMSHVAKVKDAKAQKRRVWVAVVYGYGALLGATSALLPFIGFDTYFLYVKLGVGVLMLLISTIPCGFEFLNERYIRSLRNIFFVVLGGTLMWQAISMLGWP
jgi:hypothetical protein